MTSNNNIVASFYKFSPWTDYKSFRGNIQTICEKNKVLGTILLASEGINGSISGDEMSIKNVMTYVKSLDNFSDLQIKYSKAFGKTFRKMRVRLKKEIVTMGKHGVNPHELTGKHLQPDDWDKLLDERDVIVIDTRNTYEHSIGSFIGASFTNTKSFRDFPEWADKNLNKSKNQKIAMYCTGGIRCEKASSYLLGKGYKNVYQLNGGILKYLEHKSKDHSKWRGECFVFDYRVSLEHGLEKGHHDMCHACRMPLSEEDRSSEHYVPEISCPHCYENQTQKSMKRFQERKLQLKLKHEREALEPRQNK
ncbi:MAG: rhodanese-related sulfurtransferase [Pseudomonadota bacterium]|nr:rhodanese-related sulfurtransferase [Pseudomonadota bacterium]